MTECCNNYKEYWPFCVVPVGDKWAVFNLTNCVYDELDSAFLYPDKQEADEAIKDITFELSA